jgi:tetratricopeptide (TPR) repeat protein
MMAISIISMDYDGAISLYGQCKAYAKTKEDMLYRAYLGCIACALGGDPVDGEDREVLFDKSISLGIIVSRELNICVFLRRMREKGFSKEKWNRAAETIRLLVSHYEDGCSAGLLLRELSLHEDALEAYVRATERTPREFKAWYNKGFTLWTLCRYESAAKAFDMAVKLKPGSALAWEYKGNMMWYLKHYSEALADFDRSLELDPGSWAAWRGKGVMLHNLNKPGKALKCFDRSLDLKKDYAETWNNKGYALQAVGRFKKALEAYDMALKLDPASEGAQYNKQDLEKTLNQKHWIRKRK